MFTCTLLSKLLGYLFFHVTLHKVSTAFKHGNKVNQLFQPAKHLSFILRMLVAAPHHPNRLRLPAHQFSRVPQEYSCCPICCRATSENTYVTVLLSLLGLSLKIALCACNFCQDVVMMSLSACNAVMYHTNQYCLIGSYLPVMLCCLLVVGVSDQGSLLSLQTVSCKNLVDIGFLSPGVIHVLLITIISSKTYFSIRLSKLANDPSALCLLPPSSTCIRLTIHGSDLLLLMLSTSGMSVFNN